MGDRKAVQLFAENSPANQANVYENATNLLPEEDDPVPAPSVPRTPGVVGRFIRSLFPRHFQAKYNQAKPCCVEPPTHPPKKPFFGAAAGGSVSGSMGGFCGAAAGGSVSGFFAGSKTETKYKPDGVSVSTKEKNGQSGFVSDSKK